MYIMSSEVLGETVDASSRSLQFALDSLRGNKQFCQRQIFKQFEMPLKTDKHKIDMQGSLGHVLWV
jgi:hypothetical protein